MRWSYASFQPSLLLFFTPEPATLGCLLLPKHTGSLPASSLFLPSLRLRTIPSECGLRHPPPFGDSSCAIAFEQPFLTFLIETRPFSLLPGPESTSERALVTLRCDYVSTHLPPAPPTVSIADGRRIINYLYPPAPFLCMLLELMEKSGKYLN